MYCYIFPDEAILGYGISEIRKGRNINLSTPAELLAAEAFEAGTRISTRKAPFQHFLPAFINTSHGGDNPKWQLLLRKSVTLIGKKVYNTKTYAQAAVAVFPKLINTLLIEIMDPDMSKSGAIATFQTMCSFWRTYHWILVTDKDARKIAETKCVNFVKDEKQRLKHICQDVGALLANFSCLPKRPVGFLDAYLDEAFVRCVMWWKKKVNPNDHKGVFEATKISRNIFAFQCLFSSFVVGDSTIECSKKMDSSNGQLSEVLDLLQAKWKLSRDGECSNGWNSFFEAVGGTVLEKNTVAEWINQCVQKANARGKSYGGGGGKRNNNGGNRKGGYNSNYRRGNNGRY